MQSSGYYFLILLVITVPVLVLARRTCILRDTVQDAAKFHANALRMGIANPKAPFSLARTQLAFWTVIISGSFLYVLFRHRFEVPALNNVNLILMGISVGTTASCKLIDDSQKQNPDISQNYPSEGFFTDILSDRSGVSIHRLQNVIWTLIVGLIYIQYVFHVQNLPDEATLTENLLILMGISTTAYIGLKSQENGSATTDNPGIQPIQPQQPGQSVITAQPIQPIQPQQPGQSVIAAQPIAPIQPQQPGQSIIAAQPIAPAQPQQPGQSVIAAQPIVPAQPATPATNDPQDGQPA